MGSVLRSCIIFPPLSTSPQLESGWSPPARSTLRIARWKFRRIQELGPPPGPAPATPAAPLPGDFRSEPVTPTSSASSLATDSIDTRFCGGGCPFPACRRTTSAYSSPPLLLLINAGQRVVAHSFGVRTKVLANRHCPSRRRTEQPHPRLDVEPLRPSAEQPGFRARPLAIAVPPNDSRIDRVPMDVPDQRLPAGILVNEHRLVPPLKKLPDAAVLPVEGLRIRRLQASHRLR